MTHKSTFLVSLFLLGTAITLIQATVPGRQDKILLQNIPSLTFNRHEYTNARRSHPVPQLMCTGGSANSRSELHPKTVQCTNQGWDGATVNWRCEADLDDSVKFGKLEVNCEGYLSPEDDYVLVGSCGLEYELDYVAGKARRHTDAGTTGTTGSGDSIGFGGVLLILVVVLALVWCCRSNPEGTRREPVLNYRPSRPESEFIPPPMATAPPATPPFPSSHFGSFTPSPQPFNPTPMGSVPSPFGTSPSYMSTPPFTGAQFPPSAGGFGIPNMPPAAMNSQQGNNGPGFWTGFATGGMIGSLLSNRGQPAPAPPAQPAMSAPMYSHPSPPMPTSPPASTSSPSADSGHHTATGYAKTKKR